MKFGVLNFFEHPAGGKTAHRIFKEQLDTLRAIVEVYVADSYLRHRKPLSQRLSLFQAQLPFIIPTEALVHCAEANQGPQPRRHF